MQVECHNLTLCFYFEKTFKAVQHACPENLKLVHVVHSRHLAHNVKSTIKFNDIRMSSQSLLFISENIILISKPDIVALNESLGPIKNWTFTFQHCKMFGNIFSVNTCYHALPLKNAG